MSATEPAHLADLRRHLARQPCVTIAASADAFQLRSRHGLFSARSLDAGTLMLLQELERLPESGQVLDLGCGYGAIGLTLARRSPHIQVDLVDTDIRAVESTRENIALLRLDNAKVHLSDGTSGLANSLAAYDLVTSNLPAQVGNEALDQLLLDAYDSLIDGGMLAVVAVNGLRRYLQRRLQLVFGTAGARKLRQGPRHTVLEATKRSS